MAVKVLLVILSVAIVSGCSVREAFYGNTSPEISMGSVTVGQNGTVMNTNDVKQVVREIENEIVRARSEQIVQELSDYIEEYQSQSPQGQDSTQSSPMMQNGSMVPAFSQGLRTRLNSILSDTDISDEELDEIVEELQKKVETRAGTSYAFLWSPRYNAAFVSPSGKACLQPAVYARTDEGEVSIPAAVLSSSAGSGEGTAEYNEGIARLSATSYYSTYLSVGMYGICQLAAAGQLNQNQTMKLALELFKAASMPNELGAMKPSTDSNNQDGQDDQGEEDD